VACSLAPALPGAAQAEVFVWVDAEGRTHMTDDPAEVPEDARQRLVPEGAGLGGLWREGPRAPAGPPVRGESEEARRVSSLVAGAADDLARGETARASLSLASALELDPKRPEPHWYLALLERQRGHFDASERHLRAFLASAGDGFDDWRLSAERRLAAIEDERALVDGARPRGPLALVQAESAGFRIAYDAELGSGSPDYARTVLRYLEEARAHVCARLGFAPAEPTGVVLYGKAAYLHAHRHRFSFQTVGFFDGRIHVVSQAHPAGELRALLFHEFTHALFRERVGGDRPYWLNEGLAELSERQSRGQDGLGREERAALRARIQAGRWMPLERLARGFSGLADTDARHAYYASAAAAGWILRHTQPEERAELLARIGRAEPIDAALQAVAGADTAAIDARVRDEILAEFAPAEL
jgi:hypothetical protein